MAKKSLQERMNSMKPYFKGIEMYNDALIVKVMFPQKWKIYNSADERIKATPSETTENEIFYYADSENTTFDEIFDLIEGTIKTNQDIILKIKLLRDKVEELRELFSNLSYDELLTLKFVTESPQKRKEKKNTIKKKKMPQNEKKETKIESDNPTETTVEDKNKITEEKHE